VHGILAPLTAGWQSNDVHPQVIERSEVVDHLTHIALDFLNGNFS
jgi:hypothetical protein